MTYSGEPAGGNHDGGGHPRRRRGGQYGGRPAGSGTGRGRSTGTGTGADLGRGGGVGAGAGERGQPAGHPEDHPGDPESVARTLCLRLLTAAPRTRSQLADALARRGIPDDVAGRLLARFTEVGLIDDKVFSQAWVTSRHHGRGLARRALSRELRQRGVAAEVATEAVEALDPQVEEETARALVRRRLRSTRSVEPAARARRLVAMLARKGYPPGTAYRVVAEEIQRDGADLGEEWEQTADEAEAHPDIES